MASSEYLLRIDEVWGKESPLHAEWRLGSAGKKSLFFGQLWEAVLNISASMIIYCKYLITMEAWLVSLVSAGPYITLQLKSTFPST